MTTGVYYVPIGCDCAVAYNLDRLNIRSCAFPFDWLRMSPTTIIKLIDNHFEDFLNEKYLVEVSSHIASTTPSTTPIISPTIPSIGSKFPLIDEVWNDNIIDHAIVENTKYKFKFYHDFLTYDSDQLKYVKEKYDRRIKRFYDILYDEHVRKIFIRVDKKYHSSLSYFEKFPNSEVRFINSSSGGNVCTSWKKEELDWSILQ